MAELCLGQAPEQAAPDAAAPGQDQAQPAAEPPAQDQSQPAPEQQPDQTQSTTETKEAPKPEKAPKPAPPAVASNQPSVQLDTSEALFTVLTAINVCGYDEELSVSDPLREQIRGEVAQAVQQSEQARETVTALCQLQQQHRQPDVSK